MKTRNFLQGLAASLVLGSSFLIAQEMPEMPKPQSEHKWLQQFVGEWDSEMECNMGPDKEPDKKVFVGTWVDSMMGKMWKYEGTLSEDGKTLTLNTEGPCPMQGGKVCKFKEVIVLQDKNHKTFTSSMQGEDGTWTTIVSAKSTRTK